jgi:hypothetical protein
VALLAALAAGRGASAQDWANKMFAVTSHNFGTVAKGSKTEYRFVFRNLYKEDLHVAGVRTSCGCTSPTVSKRDLKTHETAEVVATFNTRTFTGQHGATLTVTFDKPFHAEVQLRVAGNIRGDVTFDPPFVDLGNVELGKGVERTVRVTRVGGSAWEINDVRSANADFEVALSKPTTGAGQTTYDLTMRLKPEAQAGYIKGQLVLVTNDPRATQIPMDVEAGRGRGHRQPAAPRPRRRRPGSDGHQERRRAGESAVLRDGHHLRRRLPDLRAEDDAGHGAHPAGDVHGRQHGGEGRAAVEDRHRPR